MAKNTDRLSKMELNYIMKAIKNKIDFSLWNQDILNRIDYFGRHPELIKCK